MVLPPIAPPEKKKTMIEDYDGEPVLVQESPRAAQAEVQSARSIPKEIVGAIEITEDFGEGNEKSENGS